MGNSAVSRHGSVNVALEKCRYQAGDLVQGYVQVQADGQLECSELYAILLGEVRTTVHYRKTETYYVNGERKTRTVHRTAHGQQTVVRENRLIARFPSGVCPEGAFQFPFQFKLHESLLSSTIIRGHDHASLRYSIGVHLVRPGFFQKDLVHRAYFDLIAHVPHAITPKFTRSQIAVKTCCCINRGGLVLAAALERNAFQASEALVVRVQVANESAVDVEGIEIMLRERIDFWAQGHHSQRDVLLAKTALPSVPKGTGYGTKRHPETEPRLAQLILPASFAHYSMITRMLSVKHYVEVRGKTPFGSTNPYVMLGVTIHRSAAQMVPSAPLPLHGDESMPFSEPVPYLPNPEMQSPFGVLPEPSAPPLAAVPLIGGGAPAPQQQAMCDPTSAEAPATQDPTAEGDSAAVASADDPASNPAAYPMSSGMQAAQQPFLDG